MYLTVYDIKYVKQIKKMIRWFLFSTSYKFDENKTYVSQIKKEYLEKIGLIVWEEQWKALQAAVPLKILAGNTSTSK
jgi:hypothetical protein